MPNFETFSIRSKLITVVPLFEITEGSTQLREKEKGVGSDEKVWKEPLLGEENPM